MRHSAPLLLVLVVLVAGCASAPAPLPGDDAASLEVPSFDRFGAVRRDLKTGAPVWVASAAVVAARAPRFHADGSVARDPASGSPLYEERRGGVVSRVIVALP